MKPKQEDTKEMVGGCCVCSDENGWAENPLVYCDGQGCTVAVHQACYGIVSVPVGSWFCRKCESTDRISRVRCELCPSRSGALKRTDSGGWAHVVCALYIPEVRFGNVTTMEPIMLQLVPPERFNKSCYICEEKGREKRSEIGACMQCNKAGCKQHFHVICAQSMGLLCEEAGNYLDNVKYCGYCQYHYSKLRKGSNVKTIPPYRPISFDDTSEEEVPGSSESKELKLKKRFNKVLPVEPSKPSVKSPSELKHLDGPSVEPEIKEGPQASKGELKSTPTLITSVVSKSSTTITPVSTSSPQPVTTVTSVISSTVNSTRSSNVLTVSSPSSTTVSVTPNPVSLGCRTKADTTSTTSISAPEITVDIHRKPRKSGQRTPTVFSASNSPAPDSNIEMPDKPRDKESSGDKIAPSPEECLTIQYTPNVSSQCPKPEHFSPMDTGSQDKINRPNSQERGRRTKRGAPMKRGRGTKDSFKHERDSDNSSPDSFTSEAMPVSKRSRKKQDSKESINSIISNGVSANSLLLGNQINPASSVAQKMADTLQEEIQAHSIYKEDEKTSTVLVGPSIPGKRETKPNGGTNVFANSQPPPLPQSLEQLLERQWEQGSQFLMEQAQHFDIASLLSCLHQLREENARLEETVTSLIARRDHILAVNARLSVPLNASTSSHTTTTASMSVSPSAAHNSHPMGQTHPSTAVNSVLLPRSQSQSRHPSGGTRGVTSPHERRHPIENGIESEFRYRQSATSNEYQRQQSPMLPPGVQPSPNSLSRHSPAGSNYSSSPHAGVPNLSPSGHMHGHPSSIMVSTHGSHPPRPDHSRAEIVRLGGQTMPTHSSQQAFSVYQMVSGGVGPHHIPHPPPHGQMRRDVDSGRPIDKR